MTNKSQEKAANIPLYKQSELMKSTWHAILIMTYMNQNGPQRSGKRMIEVNQVFEKTLYRLLKKAADQQAFLLVRRRRL